MRIWFQSLVEEGNTFYFDGLQKRAGRIARPGTTVDFHGLPAGIYGGRPPAEIVVYPSLISLHTQLILDNGLQAQAEGYDAFVIGSVQDPGLQEARALLDIPVIAYGESAMHIACCLGERFEVIAFQPGFDELMNGRIHALGLQAKANTTRLLDMDFSSVGQALRDPADLTAAFSVEARRAISQGADVIIPGQLYLSEALARAGITRIDDAPIVDGLTATLKMAELMTEMKRLGIETARCKYTAKQPPADLLRHARNWHGRPVFER